MVHFLKQAIGRFYSFTQTDIGKALLIDALVFIFFWHCLPSPLFRTHTSTVIEDSYGNLMGAKIADDGQWRFPYNHKVPEKFQKSLVQFEDRYFYYHFGFNPWSFCRAMKQNYEAGKVVSGGSTITMQVVRLMRKREKRTLDSIQSEKFLEIALLCNKGTEVFGKAEKFNSWLETENLALGKIKPKMLFDNTFGINLLKDELTRIEYGVLA